MEDGSEDGLRSEGDRVSGYAGWCEQCRERVKVGHKHPYWVGRSSGPELVDPLPDNVSYAQFKVGDKVKKMTGYEFDATVQSVFENRDGDVRLVCESLVIPGMLHIFSPGQMRRA